MGRSRGSAWWVGVALALAALAAPAAASPAAGTKAKITRSAGGIPTIEAKNWKGLGFGYGYAFAQDNICTIADAYLTSAAERSRWFGPDAETPEGYTNLDSDLFYQRIRDRGIVEELVAQPPPDGPKAAVKQGIEGYVKGYNRYLAKTGVDNIPDPRCAGEAWVRPITKWDVYRRFYELLLYGSSGVAIDGIASAQPPAAAPRPRAYARAEAATDEVTTAERARVDALGEALDLSAETGSNAWGLGSEATASGGGIVLANPHFPWHGPRRFYQSHLVIPGKVNVSGASLFGVPLINIGHTENLAWSHTVSTAFRFTPFELTLAPGDPTSYLVDGQPVAMEADEVTVEVKQPDGSIAPESRTLYRTHYGPVTTSIQRQPLFPWTQSTAYALFDANANNMRALNHWFDTNRAQSTKELLEILRKYQGIPWVNTIAADSEGRALYADIGSIPNVPNEKATGCSGALGQVTFPGLGLPLLDGSRSECALTTDPDSPAEGLMGASQQPYLERRDYVANGNDSYWLTNPEQPLEGFARIIGSEGTQRSLRTRLGLKMIEGRLAGTDGMNGDLFTRNQVRRLVFQNRHYAGELWRDALVDYCEAHPTMVGSSGPVDVSAACPALAGWDLRVDLDSAGALLFVRFMDKFGSGAANFAQPFDLADPVNTPFGLNTAGVDAALADAVSDLRAANIALDAPYGDHHFELRGSERIPIHGGEGGQGVFNAISDVWEDGVGYGDVTSGSSFVMVTSFEGGCPKDRSILTYSLSENPESEFYADQTRMFSEKKWINPPFCPGQVKRAAESVKVIRGG